MTVDKGKKLDELLEKRSEIDKALNLSTPESLTEWLISFHGLNESSRGTVVSNLADTFRKERVKGSLAPLTKSDFDLQRLDDILAEHKPVKQDFEISIFGWTVIRIRNKGEQTDEVRVQ